MRWVCYAAQTGGGADHPRLAEGYAMLLARSVSLSLNIKLWTSCASDLQLHNGLGSQPEVSHATGLLAVVRLSWYESPLKSCCCVSAASFAFRSRLEMVGWHGKLLFAVKWLGFPQGVPCK